MAQITNFRLSFIWVEIVPAILEKAVSATEPGAFLGYLGRYAAAFDERQAQRGTRALELPWLKPKGQRFWQHYLGDRHAGDVTGVEGWRMQVPFRSALPCDINVLNCAMRVTFEVFQAPTGLALVANAYYRGAPLTPLAMTALAHDLRYRVRFKSEVAPTDGQALDSTADYALARAHTKAFGLAKGYQGQNQAFSIATVVQGSEVDGKVPFVAGSTEHRALAGMAGWYPDYPTMDLDANSLKNASLVAKRHQPGDVIYATRSGRAVWLPREFTAATARRTPRLSCYHRNLTLASVQTLLLGEFVAWVERRHRKGEDVPALVIERAKPAAALLAAGAAGNKGTYRSQSIDRLYASSQWSAAVDYVNAL